MKKFIHKTKLLALALGVCSTALFTPTFAKAEAFTQEQKQELETLFKKFLTNNPETILESVEKYRSEQEQKTQQSAQENLEQYQDYFASDDLPMAGNPDGDVTVVEFFDYNCGYCRKAYEDIMTLLEEDDNVRIVLQEMPILSPSSRTMASLAMAAKEQGKYFEMHQKLMDYKGPQSEEAFAKLAEELGLDLEQLKKDAESESVSKAIAKAMEVARALGIRGTPGFVVGDKIYPGYIGIDALRNAVEEAREANKSE